MSGYTTGTNNRLTSDGVYNYTYDDEGNRTKRTAISGGAYEDYEWDYRNRLTKVTFKTSGGTTTKVVAYTYDVFDRRIGRAVDTTSAFDLADAVIERYVYFADDVVFDFEDPDGNGSTAIAIKRRYLHGPTVDQVLAQEATSTGVVYWHLADDLGTVRDLVDNTGSVVTNYKYEAFGKVTSGDTSKTRYLFTAREYDVDTKLQFNRARWFDPAAGRWTSEDPIGFSAGDPNLARYVSNSPTNATDPSGLDDERSGPDITQAMVDHLNEFIQQNEGDLHPVWPVGAMDLEEVARANGHDGDFGDAIGDNPAGTVVVGDLVISSFHIDHILIMVYIAESYGEETARSAGQYNESFWLGITTEGSEFEGSTNAYSNADLTFNEIAILISEKLKHANANGGEVDLLTVEEILEITQGVSQEDRETIAEKPAKNPEDTTGYEDVPVSEQEIEEPTGLELPPIDL